MPYLIQFMHPAGQPPYHRYSSPLPWNNINNPHYRKFIQNKISYVTTKNSYPKEEDLFFWGEWEPSSNFTLTSLRHPDPVAINTIPNIIRYPGGNLHNTDPYVFDSNFLYTNCQQMRRNSPTKLQKLPEGSLILFGSRINKHFVLDTLFVVQSSFAYQANNLSSTLLSRYNTLRFNHAVIQPLATALGTTQFTFYIGATYAHPVQINNSFIFSFVPCSDHYFQRPVINSPYINHNLSRGFKSTCLSHLQILNEWQQIVRQIYMSNLWLGVAVL